MRHTSRIIPLVLMLAALAVRAEERRPPASTGPTNPLIGRWEVVSIGKRQIARALTPIWGVDASHITVTDREGEPISRNSYSIDRSKEPPELVMKVAGEKDRIGWFRFAGDDLQLLMTINTGEPPTSWEDGNVLVLRRAPKKSTFQPTTDVRSGTLQ